LTQRRPRRSAPVRWPWARKARWPWARKVRRPRAWMRWVAPPRSRHFRVKACAPAPRATRAPDANGLPSSRQTAYTTALVAARARWAAYVSVHQGTQVRDARLPTATTARAPGAAAAMALADIAGGGPHLGSRTLRRSRSATRGVSPRATVCATRYGPEKTVARPGCMSTALTTAPATASA
jgi:hypothetical protein